MSASNHASIPFFTQWEARLQWCLLVSLLGAGVYCCVVSWGCLGGRLGGQTFVRAAFDHTAVCVVHQGSSPKRSGELRILTMRQHSPKRARSPQENTNSHLRNLRNTLPGSSRGGYAHHKLFCWPKKHPMVFFLLQKVVIICVESVSARACADLPHRRDKKTFAPGFVFFAFLREPSVHGPCVGYIGRGAWGSWAPSIHNGE